MPEQGNKVTRKVKIARIKHKTGSLMVMRTL